jgi:class 3 adenylate cyclase/tetratricopeptide (TPR) repeat protein
MEYRVLGSLEVLDDSGHPLSLGGTRQQTVLGSLLLHAGSTVPLDRLVEEVWESPPDTAAKTVQVYVSRLRRLLPGAIETRSGGYALLLDGDRLDVTQFEQLADQGRSALGAADWERAATLLSEALALWRGPALGGLPGSPLRREADRLDEARLQAIEDRIEADLGRGHERDVVSELRALVAEHPFRERLRAQLMRALFAAGRQSEALDVYRETRRLLDEELGLEPGVELRELERRILSHDPGLEQTTAPAPLAPVAADEPVRARRPATVVFADVVDSTALGEELDPESVHTILERYSEDARAILERHGGTVEKFIGDAIVGFFGMDELHEDDALRALRAAVELRESVWRLRDELAQSGIELDVKLAVNSGDLFVGAGGGRETFATGDAVNVAARLEQLADPGEILLGERTYRLAEGAVRAERLEPLTVKGHRAKVHAWRLLELADGRPVSGREATPFVGRSRELQTLRAAFDRTRSERSCLLCTITGSAGIGKSRLAEELLHEIGDSATVAVGRCLSYGEAITYNALVEIVQGLAGEDPDRRISELVDSPEEAELVARRVRATMGRSRETATAEETFWAFRRLFEAAARERPLVAVVDDLHWGEPLLLDLLEYLVGFSSGAAIFVLCLARGELYETRPSWIVRSGLREVVQLGALDDDEAQRLVRAIGDGELDAAEAAEIVHTAEGNPLFLEQLVATRAETGASSLPPNVQAVLTARVAGLDPAERTVLEHASVEGRNFRWSTVAALLPQHEHARLGQHLMGLVRRQLIQPDPAAFAGEDAFRFSHVLIREAVYEGLPKERCADLHERLADRLSAENAEDEVIGHHLEQAFRCRAQLGLAGSRERELAVLAQARLEAAARKVLLGGDPHAAIDLLERAASLLPADDPDRLGVLPALGAALFEGGRLADADRVLQEAIDHVDADDLLRARARIEQLFVRMQAEGTIVGAKDAADEALQVFELSGDELGQSRAWCLKATVEWIRGCVAAADECWRRAAVHAERGGAERELFDILNWRVSAALYGPTPVDEGIESCAKIGERVRRSPVAYAEALYPLAALHAMRGEIDVARSLLGESPELDEPGRVYAVGLAQTEALVEMLAGRPDVAEERLRTALGALQQMGEKALLSTTAAMLAQALYQQGRLDDAEEASTLGRVTAAGEDVSAQIVWRGVKAKVLARRGETYEAEALAREAVEIAAATDFLTYHAAALSDLGEVLDAAGRAEDARDAVRSALDLYEEKGDLVSAERARRRLEPGHDLTGGAGC